MLKLCPIADFSECKKETCAWWSEFHKLCSVSCIPFLDVPGLSITEIEEKLDTIINKIK